ncbi:MAG: XRE family transcriptional regulator [Elainellaceae cyanobacterium]
MKHNKPITQLREKSGLTQAELAESIGVSENTIANWEKGKASKWIRQLHKLCQILNCTLEDLEPELKSNFSSPPVLTNTILDSVQSYCIAKGKGDKKSEAKITSYAALHDKQLHYWLAQADQIMLEAPDGNNGFMSCEVVSNTLRLENLINQLSSVPPEEIDYKRFCELVKQVGLTSEFIEGYLSFDETDFRRALVLQAWSLTVYVIGWHPGQTSGMHHHGNSLDAIYIVEGEMSHRLLSPEECYKEQVPYEHHPAQENNTGLVEKVTAGNFAFVDRRHGHQITNLSGKKLVTLHFRFGLAPEDDRWAEDPNKKHPNRRVFRWKHLEQCMVTLP